MNSGSSVSASSSKEDSSRLPPSSIVYWSRLGFAVIAGTVYNLLHLGNQAILIGTIGALGLGVLFYALSVVVVKYLLGYGEAELKGPRKHVSLGMGSYIIWLLFTIILLNTILYGH